MFFTVVTLLLQVLAWHVTYLSCYYWLYSLRCNPHLCGYSATSNLYCLILSFFIHPQPLPSDSCQSLLQYLFLCIIHLLGGHILRILSMGKSSPKSNCKVTWISLNKMISMTPSPHLFIHPHKWPVLQPFHFSIEDTRVSKSINYEYQYFT